MGPRALAKRRENGAGGTAGPSASLLFRSRVAGPGRAGEAQGRSIAAGPGLANRRKWSATTVDWQR